MFERDGVALVCDAVSLDFLKGAVVEYEDSLMRSAFQVRRQGGLQHVRGCARCCLLCLQAAGLPDCMC